MRILGIETSCDETAASVVEETGDRARPWAVRSSVIASQVPIHRAWGGVVPELASRQHLRDICGVVDRALDDGDPHQATPSFGRNMRIASTVVNAIKASTTEAANAPVVLNPSNCDCT